MTTATENHETIELLSRRLAERVLTECSTRRGEIWGLAVGELEKHLITQALARNKGMRNLSADFLGISRNTLSKKARDYGIVRARRRYRAVQSAATLVA